MKLTPSELKHAKVLLRAEAPAFAKRMVPVYKALRWRWAGAGGIPDKGQIEEKLEELISDWRGDEGGIRSGGLEIWRADKEIGLAFLCDVSMTLEGDPA